MPDNESLAKLAETLELPVAYFHAVSEPMVETILVMAQLPEEAQEEQVHRMREFAKGECANRGSNWRRSSDLSSRFLKIRPLAMGYSATVLRIAICPAFTI